MNVELVGSLIFHFRRERARQFVHKQYRFLQAIVNQEMHSGGIYKDYVEVERKLEA